MTSKRIAPAEILQNRRRLLHRRNAGCDAGTVARRRHPDFAVDASWPKPLPNNWILGQVGGITVDAQGHIWMIHRPRP